MRILTLNLNGIRSATAKGVVSWLAASGADVICLQEVRAFPEQAPPEWSKLGYHAEWYPADRPGYSGVALLSKTKPKRATRGMNSGFDSEGRVLQADFNSFSVVSTYIPSGTSSPERLAIKLKFMDEFLRHCQRLRKSKRELVFCGDFNIAHQKIDLKNWRGNQKNSGFLPEERAWMTELLRDAELANEAADELIQGTDPSAKGCGMVDVYRKLQPSTTDAAYTWWSNRGQAYAKNVGWRLDYHLATEPLAAHARLASVFKDQRFSDHAPLTIDYDFTL